MFINLLLFYCSLIYVVSKTFIVTDRILMDRRKLNRVMGVWISAVSAGNGPAGPPSMRRRSRVGGAPLPVGMAV